MNIQNILALTEQLELLGFENAGYLLLKRICFKPDSFLFSQTIKKGTDSISFHIYCERDRLQPIYMLKYYDALLQKETAVADISIAGVNTTDLERSMAAIDWKAAFDFAANKPLNWEDETSWEKEQAIETVIDGLSALENSEDGKPIATGIKLKYWAGYPYQDLFGHIIPVKNKWDICQRFYFFEGHAGISVEEAYRFLQNRWLVKQMQLKRKDSSDSKAEESDQDSQASTGNGLLQKKPVNKPSRLKRNKSSQN